MIPFLAAIALDPQLTVHLGIFRCVVVDLEAVVTLHVLVEHDETAFAEKYTLVILDLDRLEHCRKDLLLKLAYTLHVRLAKRRFSKWLGLQQAKWAKLIETLFDNLGDLADRRLLANRMKNYQC